MRSQTMKKLLLGAVPLAGCLALLAAGCDGGGGGGSGSTSPPPPTATKLAFGVQPSATTAGLQFAPAVQVVVQDAHGATVMSASTSITVAIGTNPGGGALSGTSTVPAVNGVATFSNLSIEAAGSGYTLTASAQGLSGATSAAFTVTPVTPTTRLVFDVQPGTTTTGELISPPVQVVVLDDDGNPDVGASQAITITLGANPAGGSLFGTSTAAPVQGVATFMRLNIDKPGTGYTLAAAELGTAGSTSSPFDVVGEPVATVTVAPGSVDVRAGDQFWLTALVQDAAGHLLTDRTVTWTNSDPSKLRFRTGYPTTLVDGGVVYQAVICGLAPSSVTMTATSGQESGTAQVTVSGTFTGHCFERG
jgi:hypothetical protein